jgi:hypothetical protein
MPFGSKKSCEHMINRRLFAVRDREFIIEYFQYSQQA